MPSFRCLLAAIAFCGIGITAEAQPYPSRPVRMIVPFASGGGSDTVGRVIAQALSASLGQGFVVENRTGAGGAIGADAVAKSAPDGYTLLLGSTSEIVHLVNVSTKVPYDPVKDFAPVSLVGSVPMALTVNEAVPAKTVQELVQLARAQPGKLSFGSGGTGTTTHLAVELFAATMDIKMTHVPYKGSGAIIPDLLNGNLQLGMPLLPAILPQAASGKVRILAVSTAKRVPSLPDVPTLQEAGVKGYDTTLWTGILAPTGTPQEIITRLNNEVRAALAKAEVRDALAKQGAEPIPSTPEQFAAAIRSELQTMGRLVREAGIKVE
jgi:tripartite-type tricarboxylate transporter receptor subunit TctC